MTRAQDESSLRESEVSRHYQRLPVDGVPLDLDRLIMGHARAALTEPAPAYRSWIRWGLPLGLVGSAVLAATLALDDSVEREAPPRTAMVVATPAVPKSADAFADSHTHAAGSSSPLPDTPAPTAALLTAPPLARLPPATSVAAEVQLRESAALQSETTLPPTTSGNTASSDTVSTLPANPPPADVSSAPAMVPSNAPVESVEEPASSAATDAVPIAEGEQESLFEGLDAMRLGSLSPARRAAAEERLEDIRYLRRIGRERSADLAWRRFLRDFPNFPVATEDIARPPDP